MDFLIVRAMPDNRQGRKSPADAGTHGKADLRPCPVDARQPTIARRPVYRRPPDLEVAAVVLLTRHRAARPRSRADRFLT